MKRRFAVLLMLAATCGMAWADLGNKPSTRKVGMEDVIIPGAADTVEFDSRRCDRIAFYGTWFGDSVTVYWDYTFDGINWTMLDSTAYWDTSAAATATMNKQLSHFSVAGTDTTSTFSDFMFSKFRIRLQNWDAAAFVVDTTHAFPTGLDSLEAQDDADTVSASFWNMICK